MHARNTIGEDYPHTTALFTPHAARFSFNTRHRTNGGDKDALLISTAVHMPLTRPHECDAASRPAVRAKWESIRGATVRRVTKHSVWRCISLTLRTTAVHECLHLQTKQSRFAIRDAMALFSIVSHSPSVGTGGLGPTLSISFCNTRQRSTGVDEPTNPVAQALWTLLERQRSGDDANTFGASRIWWSDSEQEVR